MIHNRGPAAPYAFTFMAPSGVEVDPAANATGTLSANSVTRFQLFNASSDLRDLVTDIRGGVSTSATFTATANPNNIDITTYLLEPTSGAPDVVNHRPVAPMPPSDVTTIHLGYLYQDDNGRFKHRMLIHNRGPAAPYAFTFMAPSGVEVDPAANATGTLSANSVTRFQLFNASSDLRDLVTDIRGGVSTSATFTATANPNNIDITTYLLEPTSGAPDVVNHRPVAPMPPSDVTTIHLGYLYQDDNGRFKHRMLIHNRGPAAPYAFTFMAPSGVEVDPAANATGTLSANSVTRFQLFNASSDLRDLVTDIRGGVSTSATFTATANPNNIDITTYLLEPTSGAPDVVNHLPEK